MAMQPMPVGGALPAQRPSREPSDRLSLYDWYSMSPEEQEAWRASRPEEQGMFGGGPPDVVWGPTDMTFTVDDIPRLEAQGEGPNAGVLQELYSLGTF